MNKKAFTLAELLITLMLIGTIAALTIPDLYMKFEEAYFKTKLMNTFSVLTEATKRMKADYGGRVNGVLGYDGWGKTDPWDEEEPCPAKVLSNPSNSANPIDNIMEMYSRYLSWVQKYPTQDNRTDILKYKDKTGHSYDASEESILVLIDGTTIAFGDWQVLAAEGTVRPINSIKPYTRRYTKHVVAEQFVVDLNGMKGPNILGRDVHYFDITANMAAAYRPCKNQLANVVNDCKTDGETCGYLWQKGISVY